MTINSKELYSRYGIELSNGKYDITNDGEYYIISTVKDDTEGCILVGSSNDKTDDNWIGSSKTAYDSLHQKVKEALERGELVTLEVV